MKVVWLPQGNRIRAQQKRKQTRRMSAADELQRTDDLRTCEHLKLTALASTINHARKLTPLCDMKELLCAMKRSANWVGLTRRPLDAPSSTQLD